MKNLKRNTALLMAVLIISIISGCTKVKDKCEGIVCQNPGTCANGNCQCSTGYEGTKCETKANAKFAGNYTGQMNCDGTSDNESIPIEALTDPLSVTIYLNSQHLLTATVSGNSITIPVQNFPTGNENYRYSGNGTLMVMC